MRLCWFSMRYFKMDFLLHEIKKKGREKLFVNQDGFFFSFFPSFFLNYRYSEVKSCSVERKLLIMHLEVVMKLI